ncbi:MAG: prolyl oligopeptidase family serine peptidase [Planctomycetaceae bacterium]
MGRFTGVLLAVVNIMAVLTNPLSASDLPTAGAKFTASDSISLDIDPVSDAKECLEGLRWKPDAFDVTCESVDGEHGDLLIRFPSSMPSGDAVNDIVCLEWYVAKDSAGKPVKARAVVVVHESGRGMTVGRIFARGLAAQGLHTFMVQMPGYGVRRTENASKPEQMLSSMKQAVADVRRARDAVVCMPLVDDTIVGVQGTSLGGFVTSTVAGLDDGFDRVYILLAGGNLHDVVLNGAKDAAKVRERLESLGIDGDKVRELARPVEPLRLAHRINPQTTWLYSGKYDDVVPPKCSFALATAAKLPEGHHIEMPADHYSGIVFLPSVMVEIKKTMTEN